MCHVDISDYFKKIDRIKVLIFAVILDLMNAAKHSSCKCANPSGVHLPFILHSEMMDCCTCLNSYFARQIVHIQA